MKLTFGQIKFFTHQYMLGIPIPLFLDKKINRQINAHIMRIYKKKTRKRYLPENKNLRYNNYAR